MLSLRFLQTSEQIAVYENMEELRKMSPKPRSVPILQVMFPSRSSYSVGMDGGMHWGTDHFKLQTLWKQGQWSSGV